MNDISMLIEYDDINDIVNFFENNSNSVMNHVLKNIDYGVKNDIENIPIFELKNQMTQALLLIVLKKKKYKDTIDFIKKWSIENQEYELAASARDVEFNINKKIV